MKKNKCDQSMGLGLEKIEARLLMRLSRGKKLQQKNETLFGIGGMIVPASSVTKLIRRGLIEHANKAYKLSFDGTMAVKRIASLEQTKKASTVAESTPYQDQHRAYKDKIFIEDSAVVNKKINAAESPLGWLATRKNRFGKPLISKQQYDAGEKFREDYNLAGLVAHTTLDYERLGSASNPGKHGKFSSPLSHRQIDARRRVDAALKAVGPGLNDSLVRVCCFNEGLDKTEKMMGWPSRSAKVILSLALDRLVAHYNNQIG